MASLMYRKAADGLKEYRHYHRFEKRIVVVDGSVLLDGKCSCGALTRITTIGRISNEQLQGFVGITNIQIEELLLTAEVVRNGE